VTKKKKEIKEKSEMDCNKKKKKIVVTSTNVQYCGSIIIREFRGTFKNHEI